MGTKRLNLPTKDAVILYIRDADGRRIKAAEIARHFDIYQGKSFGPADASRDIGDFLKQCRKRAFKRHNLVFGTSRHGHFVIKTGELLAEHQEYIGKKIKGLQRESDKTTKWALIQIKNGIPESPLREFGLLN